MLDMILACPLPSRVLTAHSSCNVRQSWRVNVSWCRKENSRDLRLYFALPRHGVRWPESHNSASSPIRVDGLWQHTCVELFVAALDGVGYREFNFATHGDWAAYDFVAYRQPAERLPQIPQPRVVTDVAGDVCLVSVELDAACLPDDVNAKFSATVVLESSSGELSYWAAHHPGPQPNFHHRDGFVLTLN